MVLYHYKITHILPNVINPFVGKMYHFSAHIPPYWKR